MYIMVSYILYTCRDVVTNHIIAAPHKNRIEQRQAEKRRHNQIKLVNLFLSSPFVVIVALTHIYTCILLLFLFRSSFIILIIRFFN